MVDGERQPAANADTPGSSPCAAAGVRAWLWRWRLPLVVFFGCVAGFGFRWMNLAAPSGLAFLLALVLALNLVGRAAEPAQAPRPRDWVRDGLCPACSYDVRTHSGRCPECGWAVIRPGVPLAWPAAKPPGKRFADPRET